MLAVCSVLVFRTPACFRSQRAPRSPTCHRMLLAGIMQQNKQVRAAFRTHLNLTASDLNTFLNFKLRVSMSGACSEHAARWTSATVASFFGCFGQCFRISYIEGSLMVRGGAVRQPKQPTMGGVGTLLMATTTVTWRRKGKDMRRETRNDII